MAGAKAEAAATFTHRLRQPLPGLEEERTPRVILFLDDPDHVRVRTPLTKALYARVSKARGPVEAIIDDVLDKLDGRDTFDVISEIAVPVPILVIAKLLGVDEHRIDEFRQWSEGLILTFHPMRTEEQTKYMVDSILFDSGKAEVKQGGLEVLRKVISILKDVMDKSIRIEGHTDNVQIIGGLAKRYPTNWELSSARAINVARYLQEQGIDPGLLSAVAYGEWKPVGDNDTQEGKAKNRRIEIILVPKE
jgi:outer membrane protein OmpA-like peptidoglycan-associated protein